MACSREVKPRRGVEDGVNLPILDDLALRLGSFRGDLHFDFRRLPGIEDELSEISSIHQLLKLSPEGTTVHDVVSHTVMEGACSWTLWVGWQWSRMPNEVLALDGVVHLVHRDYESSRIYFVPMSFGEVLAQLVDSSDCPTRSLLWGTRLYLLSLIFAPMLGGAIGRNSGDILNLDILLGADEDVPHLGDFTLHQVPVK